jgi:FK506-binding protein 4/5
VYGEIQVLEVEPQNVKALYRRGQAYVETLDLDLAEWDYKKALELDPQSRDVRSAYKTLKQKQVEQNKKEAKMYSNMFARLSKLEADEKKAEPQPMEEDKANGVEGVNGDVQVEPMSVDKAEVEAAA